MSIMRFDSLILTKYLRDNKVRTKGVKVIIVALPIFYQRYSVSLLSPTTTFLRELKLGKT